MPAEASSVSLFGIFFTSFLIGLTGALTPGPLLAVIVIESARTGLRAAIRIVMGHSILELALVIGLTYAISWLRAQTELVFLIGLPGGAYLLQMAWRTFRQAPDSAQALRDTMSAATTVSLGGIPGRLLLLGAVVSLANPFWSFWWITVGADQITLALEVGAVGVIAFYIGHILADFGWYGAIGLAISEGRSIMSTRVYVGLLRASAVLLGFLGVIAIVLGFGTGFGDN